MSRSEEQGAQAFASLEDPAACAAHDLKVILHSIADQIADCDRRQFSVLSDIQERLLDLGKGAAEARAQVPAEVAPTLSRVEDRITQLAGLLADADKDRSAPNGKTPAERHGAFAKPADKLANQDFEISAAGRQAGRSGPLHFGGWHAGHSLSPLGGEGPEPIWQPADQDFATHSAPASFENSERALSGAPAPLKSAAGSESHGGFTHRSDAGSGQIHKSVDTFDVIGNSDAAPGEQPWDREAAEALVELYETGHVHFGRPLSDEISGGSQPEVSALSSTSSAIATLSSNDPHRDWLEARFAEIATKLEQSLAEMRPDHSIDELNARFERLEARLGTELADPARADLGGLQNIERHIDDLAAQLEAAHAQFARLDTMEEEIRTLAERVSEARVGELLGSASSQDVDLVAKAVADRLSAHLPGSPTGESSSKGIEDLRALVQSFIDEKRSDEHRTDTMLDTMQQGMMRLLDRVDALEGREPPLGDEPIEHFAEVERLAEVVPVARPEVQEPHAGSAKSYEIDALDSLKASAAAIEPSDALTNEDPVTASSAIEGLASPKIEQGTESQPTAVPEPIVVPAPVGPPRSREEFIAAARRAARQASAQATAAAELARTKSGAAGLGKLGAFGNIAASRSRLMIALIALLAMGAGFTVVKAFRGSGSSSIDHQMQDPDGKQSVIDGPRQLEKAADQDPRAASRRALLDPSIPIEQIGVRSGEKVSSNLRTGAIATETGSLPADSHPAVVIADGAVTKSAAASGSGEMPPALIGPLSLRLAASKGDPSAEFEVGSRFAEGKGVQQDLKRAIVWYQRSAMQGFAPAQFRLATHYERGLGVKSDLARARDWYQRAAEQGQVKAMHNLAVLSASRDEGSPDYAAAARWFSAAAEHGLADSQYNLAVLHESGLGVARDAKQAYKWYALAARAGDTEAARRRDLLKPKLTASEQRELDAQIDIWRARPFDQALNDARAAGEAWKLRTSETRAQ